MLLFCQSLQSKLEHVRHCIANIGKLAWVEGGVRCAPLGEVARRGPVAFDFSRQGLNQQRMFSEGIENRKQLRSGATQAKSAPQFYRILVRKTFYVATEAMRYRIFAGSLKLGGIETRTDQNAGHPDLG